MNETDATYTLKNMVRNVIMVMGKGRERCACEANTVRNHVGDLASLISKRTETEWEVG